MLVALSICASASAGVYWQTPYAVFSGICQYTVLRVDEADRPFVAYHDFWNRDLCIAARTPEGGWVSETVDSSGDVGRFASMEISGDGRPRISYFDFTNGRLKYAERREDGWHIEALTPFPCSGWYSSLALDSAGRPHIAFTSCATFNLYYARRDDSGNWTFETLDSAGDVGLYCSLRIHNDLPRISYYDRSAGNLKYAEKSDTGVWSITVVDSSPRSGLDTSLALDAAGRPHITYWDQGNGDLKYAFRQDGLWVVEIVDSEGWAGYESSLSVTDRPRVSYAGAAGLRFAERVDGCWHIYKIEEQGSAAGYTSLAIDRHGNPRITHLRSLSQTLEYREGIESTSPVAPKPVSLTSTGVTRTLADGTWVALSGPTVVSDAPPAGWHVEACDRSAGIRLKMPEGCQMPAIGDSVKVVGVVETLPGGDRRINVCEWEKTGTTQAPQPLCIITAEPLAVGLLVSKAGVARVDGNRVFIGPDEVLLASGWPIPAQGDFCIVTGILVTTDTGFAIRPRSAQEVVVVEH